MVLQRARPVPIWGQAAPGVDVSASFGDQTRATKSNDDGSWRLELDPLAASKVPRELVIRADDETIRYADVLVGEVWLCSGQSNMQMPLIQTEDAQKHISKSNHPDVRLFKIPSVIANREDWDVDAHWTRCQPQTARNFSAVGYFCGRELHEKLDVPVGLIHSTWSGSMIEPWIRTARLASRPDTRLIVEKWEGIDQRYPDLLARWKKQTIAYFEKVDADLADATTPNGVVGPRFALKKFDDEHWGEAILPGTWEPKLGRVDGVVWYRKRVTLPAGFQSRALQLHLGRVDDDDRTYVDGRLVGQTTGIHRKRSYTVPAELTSGPEIVIAVRVFDRGGHGGFHRSKLRIEAAQPLPSDPTVVLDGPWKMHMSWRIDPSDRISRIPVEPMGPRSKHHPGILQRSMIQPVAPYALRGVLWYQGESNSGNPRMYKVLLGMLIADWRDLWGHPRMPWGIVQLSSFRQPVHEPTDLAWAHIRDAQFAVSRSAPYTGLAVTIDIGSADDIHPGNKKDVGHRLAHWALHDVYGLDVIRGGPVYQQHTVGGNKVVIKFGQIGQGLAAKGGQPAEFTVAGSCRIWYRAQARIVSPSRVEVWSDQVPDPVATRYAWADNPQSANLVNSHGLPASPFRTDDWP